VEWNDRRLHLKRDGERDPLAGLQLLQKLRLEDGLPPLAAVGEDHLEHIQAVEDGLLDRVPLGEGPLNERAARKISAVVPLDRQGQVNDCFLFLLVPLGLTRMAYNPIVFAISSHITSVVPPPIFQRRMSR